MYIEYTLEIFIGLIFTPIKKTRKNIYLFCWHDLYWIITANQCNFILIDHFDSVIKHLNFVGLATVHEESLNSLIIKHYVDHGLWPSPLPDFKPVKDFWEILERHGMQHTTTPSSRYILKKKKFITLVQIQRLKECIPRPNTSMSFLSVCFLFVTHLYIAVFYTSDHMDSETVNRVFCASDGHLA